MERTAFMDQYKDPRWQRKRLEIMERDKFSCVFCEDSTASLNVHHKFYKKGKKVWEYEDSILITLCETCHEKLTKIIQNNQESLSDIYQNLSSVESISNILRCISCMTIDELNSTEDIIWQIWQITTYKKNDTH
jgi:hypothetical protein